MTAEMMMMMVMMTRVNNRGVVGDVIMMVDDGDEF
jgi:hypothetical protein